MDSMGDVVLNNGSWDGQRPEAESRVHEIEEAISETGKTKINGILKEVDTLSMLEKLLLYFKLPTENSFIDPLKQPTNPLGSRTEINLTIQWIKTHLEEDPDISLQKKNVYDEYTSFCVEHKIKALSTADFGKVMKQVYPNVKPRRLGTRGNSQYCYSGLRTRVKLQTPNLPDLSQKPQSTEFTISSDSDLFNAIWCVVKEWSESQLGEKFGSFYSLAHYLVKKLSIGTGTNAAAVIVSALQNEQNSDLFAVNSNRHKEMIRKIQLKCEGKEQKRKLQAQQQQQQHQQQSKVEQRPRAKRAKLQTPSTSRGASPTTPTAHDSKQQLAAAMFDGPKPICDKSLDFRNGGGAQPEQAVNAAAPSGKVPIPRLAKPQLQSSPPAKNMKYKHIQPKCDTATYNPQQQQRPAAVMQAPAASPAAATADARSHEIGKFRRLRRKEETVTASLLDDDTNELLSRQRLISVGNLDKDALDEYLGKNNSQENEEEITRYYENSIKDTTEEDTKLSQLRTLLEQTQENNNVKTDTFLKGGINFGASLNAKRRVSFDPCTEDVPPSPNTRTKNYNFMPISPGSKSPSASPFVSPRNTPVPRARGNSHPYVLAPLNKNKKKKEYELSNLPMSAPPSPKVSFSNAPIFHYGDYKTLHGDEINLLDAAAQAAPSGEPAAQMHIRSQSVPVHNFNAVTYNNMDFGNYSYPEKINELMTTLDNTLPTVQYVDQISHHQQQQNISSFDDNFAPLRGRPEPLSTENIDLSYMKMAPSRSVPSTPLPLSEPTFLKQENAGYSSRSYPSTPLTNDTFKYQTQDYLLNGQPIKEKLAEELDLSLMDIEPKQPGMDMFAGPNFDNNLVDNNLVDNNLVDNNLVDNNLVDNTLVDNNLVDNNLVDNSLVDNKDNIIVDFVQLEGGGFVQAKQNDELGQEFETIANDCFFTDGTGTGSASRMPHTVPQEPSKML